MHMNTVLEHSVIQSNSQSNTSVIHSLDADSLDSDDLNNTQSNLLLTTLRQQAIAPDLVPFLASYRLIPHLLGESILEQAIAPIECTGEETAQACEALYQQWGLNSADVQQQWRSHYGLTQTTVEQLATRALRLQKFQEQTWGHRIGSYFLKHKARYDRVIYSLLRTTDLNLANELYFRILEGEQSFAELARTYAEGPESASNGIIGPMELGAMHPLLASLCYRLAEGELHPPVALENWYVLVRVEKKIAVSLDDSMRQRLLKEQFDTWFQEQLQQLSPFEQIWMGVKASEAS